MSDEAEITLTESEYSEFLIQAVSVLERAKTNVAGVDRKVMWLNPVTRQEGLRPLHEVATSHTARKTFIGNLYKQVQDPNLIASLSGHTDGSRDFARYRQIDDEMKRKLVDMLD